MAFVARASRPCSFVLKITGKMPVLQRDADDRLIENRRAVAVDRHALFRVERHARLARFAESDQVAVVRADLVVGNDGFTCLARLAREAKAILNLKDQKSPASERVIRAAQA